MRPVLVGVTLLFFCVSGLSAADPKPAKAEPIPATAKATLEAAGLKVSTGGLVLPEEAALAKAIRELARDKKEMMAADRDIYAGQKDTEAIKARLSALRAQHTNLSAQVANATDTITHNRLVGALNATRGEAEQLAEQKTQLDERLKEARKKAAELREAYVFEVSEARTNAEAVTAKWAALAADPAASEAVGAINKALGSKFALQPSTSFVANAKQLKTMEEAVSSEAIKLTNEGSGFWVNVTINDKHKSRMVVDSGAFAICLSEKMVRDMGIKFEEEGTPSRVTLADGRTIPTTMIKLESVRVGKFTAQNVDCCVLSSEARDAPPLLGMSFLGQFKFEIDATQAELKLVKVDSGEPVPKDAAGEKGKAAKKKK